MKRNEIKNISANFFFFAGLLYYLVTPYFTVVFFGDNFLVTAALAYISLDHFNIFYWIDVIAIGFSFVLGYSLSPLLNVKAVSSFDGASNYKIFPVFLSLFLATFIFAYLIKLLSSGVVPFSGYKQYDITVLGPISTVAFTSALFYNYYARKFAKVTFLFLFLISTVILLGLGSRMYFTLGAISIVLGSRSDSVGVNGKKLIFYVFIICTILLVGAWRSGYAISEIENLVAIFLVEPLFTIVSGFLYLDNVGARPLYNVPADVLASFVNFIPSILYPEKINFINELTVSEFKDSPFGASSIVTNLYSNFGILYPGFVFFIGILMGTLNKLSLTSRFYKAVYLSLLPVILFLFFRDGFITTLKIFIFNAFILPLLVICIALTVFRRQHKKWLSGPG